MEVVSGISVDEMETGVNMDEMETKINKDEVEIVAIFDQSLHLYLCHHHKHQSGHQYPLYISSSLLLARWWLLDSTIPCFHSLIHNHQDICVLASPLNQRMRKTWCQVYRVSTYNRLQLSNLHVEAYGSGYGSNQASDHNISFLCSGHFFHMCEHNCCYVDNARVKSAISKINLFHVNVTSIIISSKNGMCKDFQKISYGRVVNVRRILPFHVMGKVSG